MSARTAFVTGATGFVGANVVRALLENEWNVRALARPGSDRRNLAGLELEIVEGDVTSAGLSQAMRGADALFHVAAHYSLWRSDRDAVMRSNVEGTRNVLAAARAAGVPRTVYTSSVGAIGVKHGGVADETFQSSPEELIGSYKLSKFLAEREAAEAAGRGQDVVIVNPTAPVGAWDRKPTPTGEILVRFLSGRMPVLVPTGLNFVGVTDVARGHLLAYERGRPGERYILGDENLSLRAFLQRAGAIAGRSVPRYDIPLWIPLAAAWTHENIFPRLGRTPKISVDSVLMSKESMYYDVSKAKSELGYAPGPVDEGIREALAWFAEHGYLSKRSR